LPIERQLLGVRRLVAAFARGGLTPHSLSRINRAGRDRSLPDKALTGQRTPRS